MTTIQLNNNVFFALLEEELKDSKKVRFLVKGNSMYPLIRNEKDEVKLVECNAATIKPGDILLFKFRGQYILHRLIHKEQDLFIFQGDNVWYNKEYCKANDIVGIVESIYRKKDDSSDDTYVEVSPNSTKWHFLILLNQSKNKIRRILSRIYHLFR